MINLGASRVRYEGARPRNINPPTNMQLLLSLPIGFRQQDHDEPKTHSPMYSLSLALYYYVVYVYKYCRANSKVKQEARPI